MPITKQWKSLWTCLLYKPIQPWPYSILETSKLVFFHIATKPPFDPWASLLNQLTWFSFQIRDTNPMKQLASVVSNMKHISILYYVINFMILLCFLIMPKPQEFQERIFITELKDLSAETGDENLLFIVVFANLPSPFPTALWYAWKFFLRELNYQDPELLPDGSFCWLHCKTTQLRIPSGYEYYSPWCKSL